MEVKKYSIFNPQIQDFVKRYANSIFDTPEWLTVLRDNFNSEVSYYCLKDNNQIVLCLGATLLDFKFIRILQSNFPYGGFMGDKRYIPIFIEILLKESKKEKIHLLKIVKTKWNDFDNLVGFNVLKNYQQVLNLDGLTKETLWKNYKKRIRRDIRKAQRLGVIVESIKDRREIELLSNLYLETMKRNKTYPHINKKSLYSIYDNLYSKDEVEILFAKLNQEYIGAVLILNFNNIFYYFLNASSTKYLYCCPNDLLVHTAIDIAIDKKAKYFDFMITPFSDKSLIDFKEKWGAELYPIYTFEKRLSILRANLWNITYKFINTPWGSYFIRMMRR